MDNKLCLETLKKLMDALEARVLEGQEFFYAPILLATLTLAGLLPDHRLQGPDVDTLIVEVLKSLPCYLL